MKLNIMKQEQKDKFRSYDLEEKLGKFGEKIIGLAKRVPRSTITRPVISQLIRAGTSIGANYMEANGASSKKDFKNKIHICKKEAKETMHWLRMLAKTHEKTREQCRILWQEAQGYAKMFSKILTTLKNKKNKN